MKLFSTYVAQLSSVNRVFRGPRGNTVVHFEFPNRFLLQTSWFRGCGNAALCDWWRDDSATYTIHCGEWNCVYSCVHESPIRRQLIDLKYNNGKDLLNILFRIETSDYLYNNFSANEVWREKYLFYSPKFDDIVISRLGPKVPQNSRKTDSWGFTFNNTVICLNDSTIEVVAGVGVRQNTSKSNSKVMSHDAIFFLIANKFSQ